MLTCENLHYVLRICDEKHAPWIGRNATHCGKSTTPLARRFCPGTCANYCSPEVVGEAAKNHTVLVEPLLERTLKFRRALEQQLKISPRAIRDIATIPFGNRSVRVDAKEALRLVARGEAHGGAAAAYAAQFARLTNFNRSAAVIEIVLPRGQAEDAKLLRRIRAIAETPEFAGSGFGFLTAGDIPALLDAVDEVMSEAPTILAGTTSVVVFLIAGLAFRSLLIPLRLLLTIFATLVLTAGSAVLTYQTIDGLDGVYWLLPIACGCLVIGLTIDYDVFLVSRIYELRHEGFSTEGAIVRAMDAQSGTITTAGLIMTIAFSSLLLSSTTVLNQWGFMLVVASLYDTFVVRASIVPSLMFAFVEANWWPGRVPAPLRAVDGAPVSLHVN